MSPSKSRRGAAVLGSPIAHSLSPVLHAAAYDALGLDGWDYRAVECTAAGLAATLRGLDAAGLAGASLTMPLKRAVVPMLAAMDRVTARLGVANTVLFGEPGRWDGANTDVAGIVATLRSLIPAGAGTAVVLGAGATAASALAALPALGFEHAVVVARRPAAAADLVPVASSLGLSITVRGWEADPGLGEAALVVSTTPAGATDALAGAVTAVSGLLFDVVYAPWPTALAAAWRAAGGQVVGGLDLLVAQAAEQVRLMTGRIPPVARMREAGYTAIGRRL